MPVEGQPWTVPAFRITEKDGFLWGRGVNDDKGMAAVIVALALEMGRTKPALSRDVIFALTSGEEMCIRDRCRTLCICVSVSPAAPTSTIVIVADTLYGEMMTFWPAPTAVAAGP